MVTLGASLDEVERPLRSSKREQRRTELEAKVQELLGSSGGCRRRSRWKSLGSSSVPTSQRRSHGSGAISSFGARRPRPNEPCGKKLDFIVQEMNREVNTIGSKSQDAEIAEHVIAMKSELERVREQVQNIE